MEHYRKEGFLQVIWIEGGGRQHHVITRHVLGNEYGSGHERFSAVPIDRTGFKDRLLGLFLNPLYEHFAVNAKPLAKCLGHSVVFFVNRGIIKTARLRTSNCSFIAIVEYQLG